MTERYAWTSDGMELDPDGQWVQASDYSPSVPELTDQRVVEIGYRYAWQYKHNSRDPADHSRAIYTYNAHCLSDLLRAVERELLDGGDKWTPLGHPIDRSELRITEFRPLDYIKTDEGLEEYVQARITAALALSFPTANRHL